MSIWGTLFGSKSVIDNAAKGIYNGVDKAFYTDEEKAGGFLDLLKAYEPFKLAQRLLMLVITIPFVFVWLMCALLMVASAFVDPQCVAYPEIATQCVNRFAETAKTLGTMNTDTLGVPTAIVLSFYFGGGALEGVVDRFKGKSSSK